MQKLTNCDYQLIQAAKGGHASLREYRLIIAKHVSIDETHIKARDIATFLMDVCHKIGAFEESKLSQFILELNPARNFMFTCSTRDYLQENTTDYFSILISRLDSTIALTEVKYIPGYKEYLAAQK
jgi:hypothetical protein